MATVHDAGCFIRGSVVQPVESGAWLELVGDIGVRNEAVGPRGDGAVMVGYTLSPRHQGHGLATEGVSAQAHPTPSASPRFALGLYGGRGACRVYESDLAVGAMEIQRVEPGGDLWTVAERPERIRIGASVAGLLPMLPLIGEADAEFARLLRRYSQFLTE